MYATDLSNATESNPTVYVIYWHSYNTNYTQCSYLSVVEAMLHEQVS